jgi:GNAT superfamily N-acetyltransferase
MFGSIIMSDLELKLLKECPDCIPQLAFIWQEVLGSIWLPDVPIERVKSNYLTHLNDNELPLTFVALLNNEPVGMCSLRDNDGILPEVGPWLGSLVVKPDAQKKGIGALLISRVKEKATELGFNKLHLFAFDRTIPHYYQSLGWNVIGVDKYKEHPVTVMDIRL